MRVGRATGYADLTARVGSITLPNPILTASGTAGHGAELARYVDLSTLGAVVAGALAGAMLVRVHDVAAARQALAVADAVRARMTTPARGEA